MLTELSSSAAVREFIQSYPSIVVTFSAHWCGPCNRSKPQLMDMAAKYAAESSTNPRVKIGIVYEEDLRDEIHTYKIRAFPTYALFQQGSEKQRVEGANLPAVQQMIDNHCKDAMPMTGGETLGGGNANVLTPEQAREARLARLQGTTATTSNTTSEGTTTTPMDEDKKDDEGKKDSSQNKSANCDNETKKNEDVEMKDANETEGGKDDSNTAAEGGEMVDPTKNLDETVLSTLMNEMGFSKLRAQKGLLYGNGSTVESAVEWLMEHQEDADIDEPISMIEIKKTMTPEEKAAKIAEIKELMKKKRAEREDAEKVDNVDREKQRRFMGKEMSKTREQLEMDQRKRDAQLRKKEKEDFKKERARLRAELAKDKAERQTNKGKLSSKLGVDGYNPNVVQYDVPMEGQDENVDDAVATKPAPTKKSKADVNKIDEYIAKVSGYRAGGDGGKCLKILKIYVTNALEKGHEDEKFRNINTDNKAYKAKVKPFLGAKNILLAVGFKPSEDGSALMLDLEDFDQDLMTKTKEKLEAAIIAYG